MSFKIISKIKGLVKRREEAKRSNDMDTQEEQPISANIDENIQLIKNIFDRCSDVVMRELKLSIDEPVRAFLVYIEGLAETKSIADDIMEGMQLNTSIVSSEANQITPLSETH